jgi:hypothetical protein
MMASVFGPTPVATAGTCVFGQGDCGPKVNNVSQSFNQTLTENIKNTLISKSVSIGAVMAAEQIIDFSGADMSKCENVNISGIAQKAVLNYNFDMLDSSIDESSFVNLVRGNVEKTLKQNLDAKTEALNGGNTGVVNNISQTYTNSVDRLVNSINYNDFKNVMMEMKTRQKVSFAGMTLGGKYCNISGINQDIMMEMAAKVISEKITKEFTNLAKENSLKEATESKNTFAASGVIGDLGRGISGITSTLFTGVGNLVGEFTKPMIMIAIVILVCIVAYVIYRAMMSGKLEGFAEDPRTKAEHAEKMRAMELQQRQQGQQGQPLGTMQISPEITGPTPEGLAAAQYQQDLQAEAAQQPQGEPLVTPQQEMPRMQAVPPPEQIFLEGNVSSTPSGLQSGVAGPVPPIGRVGEYQGEGFFSDLKDNILQGAKSTTKAIGQTVINAADKMGIAGNA